MLLLAVIFWGSCRKYDRNEAPSKTEKPSAPPSISNADIQNWFVKNPMGKYLSVDWKEAKQISIGNVAVVTVPITHISLPASVSISSSDKKVNDAGPTGNAVLTTFDPYHPPVLYFFQDKTRANPDSVKGLLMNFAPDDPKKENGARKLWTGTLSEWNMQGDSIFCQHLTKSMVNKKYLVNLDPDAQGNNAAKLSINTALKTNKSIFGIIWDAVKTITEAIGWVFQIPGWYGYDTSEPTQLTWCDFLWGLFSNCDVGGGGGGGDGDGDSPPGSYAVIFNAFIPGYDGFPGSGDWSTYYANGGGWSSSPNNPCNMAIVGGGQAVKQVDPGSGCGGTQVVVTTAMVINYTAVKYNLTSDQQYWLNNNVVEYYSITNFINSNPNLSLNYFDATDYINFAIWEMLEKAMDLTDFQTQFMTDNIKMDDIDTYSGDEDDDPADLNNPTPRIVAQIPTQFTLNNGQVLNVVFGFTKSDHKSAYQNVSVWVISMLNEALNKEAQALPIPFVPITSIYIRCTTNGIHTNVNSNHYKGLALDISRINGVPIIYRGADELVKQLQIAFDQSLNIRENFGPYLKHKFGSDHAVGGHKDHIHVSVTVPQ